MARTLPVPYKSQWDEDARRSRKDCGPACVAMLLHYYDTPADTDQVFAATGAGEDAFVNIRQMRQAAQQLGLELSYRTDCDLDDLRPWLDEGLPFIALVNYGVWSSAGLTQDTYTDSHFVVVVGYDEDNVLINDPNYWGDRRAEGDHKAYPTHLFHQAWHDLLALDNPNGAVLLPEVPPPPVESLPAFGPATISREAFCERLAAVGSPLAGREGDLAYTMAEVYGVDPAFPLALFFHASRLGTQGDTLTTRNPGLLTDGSDGVDISVTLLERGRLQRYHAWLDGWRAMLRHLVAHHHTHGRTTVAQILSVWDTSADASAVIGEVEQTMEEYADL